jgi:hypothetical protein
MITEPGPQPASRDQASHARQHLAAIAASLTGHGIPSRLTRLGGVPVLTIDQPGGGPDRATVSIDPGPGVGPGQQFDCTCIWTPAPGATPQATAGTIITVLDAIGRAAGPPGRRARTPRAPRRSQRPPGPPASHNPAPGRGRPAPAQPGRQVSAVPGNIIYAERAVVRAAGTASRYLAGPLPADIPTRYHHPLPRPVRRTPMTGPVPAVPAGQPACDDLTARVFRALYAGFDLHHVGGTYVVIPKGTPCFAGPSLGDIVRQISDREHPGPPPPGAPAAPGKGPPGR